MYSLNARRGEKKKGKNKTKRGTKTNTKHEPGVPGLDGFVIAAGEEERAVASKAEGSDVARVAFVHTGGRRAQRCCVKQLDATKTSDGHVPTARRDRKRVDLLAVRGPLE